MVAMLPVHWAADAGVPGKEHRLAAGLLDSVHTSSYTFGYDKFFNIVPESSCYGYEPAAVGARLRGHESA